MKANVRAWLLGVAAAGAVMLAAGLVLAMAGAPRIAWTFCLLGGATFCLGAFVGRFCLPRCPHCHNPIQIYSWGKGLHCVHCGKVLK